MSALLCGCDTESLWMCEEHRPKTGTVQQESFTQYKERLLNEILMRGSTAASFQPRQTSDPSPAEQFRTQAVATAAAVETRDDLLNRIATLEAELAQLQRRAVKQSNDYLYLLQVAQRDHERTTAELAHARDQWAPDTLTARRIAVILTRFYTEPLSLSSVQPLIALALELNPDLVERAR